MPGLNNTVEAAKVFTRQGKLRAVTARSSEGLVLTELPLAAPDPVCSVIALELNGKPDVTPEPLSQEADGSFRLAATDADLHGSVRLDSAHKEGNIGFWIDPADTVSWTINVREPGRFVVEMDIAAEEAARFELLAGEERLEGASRVTCSFSKFETVRLEGFVAIKKSGSTTLQVKPIAANWKRFNLKSVRLTKVPMR